MRIIAGEFKGMVIQPVKGRNTRPTSSRIKESIFNILQHSLEDQLVLDLFAGTGNLGLEALSRGCSKVVFVEKDPSACQILLSNCRQLGCQYRSELIKKDVFKALKILSIRGKSFDVIFIDPPYQSEYEIPTIQSISEKMLLSKNGIIVLEHDSKNQQPEQIHNIVKYDVRKYGNTCISFYRRK